MGGMPAILRNFRPRELWVGIDPASAAYTALLREAADLHIRVRHLHAGDTPALARRPLQPRDLTSSPPPSPTPTTARPSTTTPSSSTCSTAAPPSCSKATPRAPSERAMLAAHAITPVTLLKVGHHGSRTSTTPDFLAAAAPRDAVISVGRHNTFGHPRPEVLARLAQAHTLLYRTDEFGLTQFLLPPTATSPNATTNRSNPLVLVR